MNCAICNVEMKEYDRHNPVPLFLGERQRVCRECNRFVTASRIHLIDVDPLDKVILAGMFAEILKTAFALKKADEQHAKMLQEEEE
tara:strand:- start:3734 stop:3991 length:258 start_codon:yes stop_codon:yes gene_type:complete